MRRTIVIAMFVGLVLFGCGPSIVFQKEDATPQETEMAKLECQQMAAQINGPRGGTLAYADYLRCMKAKGYRW